MRLLTTALLVCCCLPALRADDKTQLREKLRDDALRGDWVYDDVAAGFARAKQTGKPMLVVFRCVL
jgi:hypothetical protein